MEMSDQLHTPRPLYLWGKSSRYTLDRRLGGGVSESTTTTINNKHDQVCKTIHQKLAYKYGLLNKMMPYYKYIPNTILENETIKLYWEGH
jgi:archaellum biogenesis ATPase FlaH